MARCALMTHVCQKQREAAPQGTLGQGGHPKDACVMHLSVLCAPVSVQYARDNVKQHLEAHYGSEECQEDIQAIRQQ
eukprot:scaffold222006_cov22-Tisochrysis_lutea.AAC.1